MLDVKIKKRDLNLEPFSYDKLLASITKSGVSVQDAERLAETIKSWIFDNSQDGVISSTAVRDKVYEVLASQFPVEADEYQAFKKG